MAAYQDVNDRLTRIESRVCQILVFLGGDPYGPNDKAGIQDVIAEALTNYDNELEMNDDTA